MAQGSTGHPLKTRKSHILLSGRDSGTTVEKAILALDLGLNPTNDGKVIRLSTPVLTEERRGKLVKQHNDRHGDVACFAKDRFDGQVAVRNRRQPVRV